MKEKINLLLLPGDGIGPEVCKPVKKIINSTREIREILYVDLNACNNYQNGKEAINKVDCPCLFIFGELDKMVNLEAGKKFSNLITILDFSMFFLRNLLANIGLSERGTKLDMITAEARVIAV